MAGLFEPLELREGVVARNRIWLAPLTNMQSHTDGTLSDDELRFLSRRAAGGFGLVETCAAHVKQDGKAWPGELGVHDDAMLPGLTRLAKAIHQDGALLSAQLFHGGLRADPAVSGLECWGPSAHRDERSQCRAATEEDILSTIDAFASAARRCDQAGFDGVELHGAHGYVLSQFLSTVYNQREDTWGGSLENRSRLLRETLTAVRRAVPSRVLAVRISPEDYGQAKGLDLDENLEVARMLADAGMDVLHLSLWRAALNTLKRPQEHAVTLFRRALPSRVKIVVAGAIWTREDAEAQLARGADAVALGRGAIANHDWPQRIHRGEDLHLAPVSEDVLLQGGASPGFVGYLRGWKNFVAP
ncbi:FAD/FMN-binding oxidoreductase [Myxococcus stipitatus DSM 14675]|uniref:FAD/FMN-binding oxidoreductase n=1 Tax=Myxococcus stipitatus (strain DSM 14675 / JCM 12634 / Mx s8) TaxID=1278073 RepID=L7UEE7_MYXSD|nr:NADH:flavin oxidoreductase [Myxococcus stipitatus]AGC47296.1 FAD/FMN-binding oxidoreductase [Myxococcus stipitatus DSM 14675]